MLHRLVWPSYGFNSLAELRHYEIQPQVETGQAQVHLRNETTRPLRHATLVSKVLSRLQMNRLAAPVDERVLGDEADALAWLQSGSEATAGHTA